MVRVVISTRECSGMKRRGRGMPDYRQGVAESCCGQEPDGGVQTRAPGNARRSWPPPHGHLSLRHLPETYARMPPAGEWYVGAS